VPDTGEKHAREVSFLLSPLAGIGVLALLTGAVGSFMATRLRPRTRFENVSDDPSACNPFLESNIIIVKVDIEDAWKL
jgi:hypothetical protein